MEFTKAAPIALLLVVASGTVAQLLLLNTMPLVDWPNHLARLHALGAGAGDVIRRAYAPHWALMPDLACDLLYLALKRVLSPEAVLRLCLAGSLLVAIGAIWRIHWLVFKTTTYSVSIAPLMISGLSVSMGYVNYVAGISVVLVAIALAVSGGSCLSVRRVSVLSVLATVSWICHIAAYSVFALIFGVTLLYTRPKLAGAGRAVMPTVKSVYTYLVIVGPGLLLSLIAERPVSNMAVSYGDNMQKLRFLLAPWLAVADPSSMALLPVVVAVVVLLGKFGSCSMSPVLKPAILLLGATIALLPWQVGDAIDVDARLVLPFTALVLASTQVVLPKRIVLHGAITALVVLALAVRLEVVEHAAQATDTEVVAFRKLAAKLPIGTAIMVARDTDKTDACRRTGPTLPLLHLASYAAIDRGAYVPSIFTATGMQPLRAVKAPFDASARPIMPPSLALLIAIAKTGDIAPLLSSQPHDEAVSRELQTMMNTKNTALLNHWPASYDALLVLHDGCPRNLMPSRLSVLGEGGLFTLYSVQHTTLDP